MSNDSSHVLSYWPSSNTQRLPASLLASTGLTIFQVALKLLFLTLIHRLCGLELKLTMLRHKFVGVVVCAGPMTIALGLCIVIVLCQGLRHWRLCLSLLMIQLSWLIMQVICLANGFIWQGHL
jgi:hypothetical protein